MFDRQGVLAGGLYGVRINGLFAGESMFHLQRDASKVALAALVDLMRASGMTLLDVQWQSDHLKSLGVIEVPRARYLELLRGALSVEDAEGARASAEVAERSREAKAQRRRGRDAMDRTFELRAARRSRRPPG